ncbi:MAG: N-acetyl-gamma-glutamyl-phosphate reductase [Turneriella sp.]|nr:N-acetyl-gamma-glutamyl-phosphate reductase [Leptospiraceae bacterium]MCX7632977.1 N-acetyl-gamma-glutamyl-phosphate reductase [Turneriella sp.]
MKAVRVGILGAGGFTGQELIRIFARHPQVKLCYATSSDYAGKTIAEIFPALASPKTEALIFSAHPQEISDIPELDAVLLATPDDVSLKWVPQLLAAGYRVIDLSGAFRIKDPLLFQEFYGLTHNAPEVLAESVYGLTELYREKIAQAHLVANPGCYPTAALLPLYAYHELIDFSQPVIIDAKSGTSGAGGRREKDSLGYSTVYENFRAYKTAKHQHTPELMQELNRFSGQSVRVRFTPHLLPLYRGILCTSYARLKADATTALCHAVAADFANREHFLRYRQDPDRVELRAVQHTNFCDFAHWCDEKNGLIEIVSAIDNLMKGAAGQAVQNLNLMFGFPEAMGVNGVV